MNLITDAGSTKTDWSFCEGEHVIRNVRTQGINPCNMSRDPIMQILTGELLFECGDIRPADVSAIYYYGAGCATQSICEDMKAMLQICFPKASIWVESDMLGAARALCGHKEGIACILGTGSNSCLYDGNVIVDQTPSLGYILGDEGSSTAIGRHLLSDCLKRQLPEDFAREFMERYHLTQEIIIENVYRKPMANRYMAGFTPFLAEKRDVSQVHKMLVSCFREFLQRNVMNYHRSWLPINFIGTLASSFDTELAEAAESLGLSVGNIQRSPMEGLVMYHS
ncbi:MAG: ATPase [Bacteroidaceae bacterium]|nr:ATPase [Bacteroidaceae bacterium]